MGDGTYDYTIQLHNNAGSTSINTFWFAWVPDYYGYDLLTSAPTVTQSPFYWYSYVINNSYYYPDGYSIEFLNYGGPALNPGDTFTFGFNSADSPSKLQMHSDFYGVDTLTSYVYQSYPGYDAGGSFVVQLGTVPEPSALVLLGLGVISVIRSRPRVTKR